MKFPSNSSCFSKVFFVFISILSSSLLSACGGGGDETSSGAGPGSTVIAINFGIKQLQFSWSAVDGATHYKLMENPDGASGFSQIGTDITTTTYNHQIAVHQQNWANARYLIQSCNATGCSDSNEVNTLNSAISAIGYLKASNPGNSDVFGNSLDLSADGKTLAVGAMRERSSATGINGDQSNDAAVFSGAVYVFTYSSGAWSQQAYIKASDTNSSDNFGQTVSISADGNTLAVGASGEDSSATGINGLQVDFGETESGAVYVFVRDGLTWSQQTYIKASNTDSNDYFGKRVSLSADGNTLAVGAPGEDSNATGINGNQSDENSTSSGAAYVFVRSGITWLQQAYVKASNTGSSDEFGDNVSLSGDGNTLAIGAPGQDANNYGMVYIYVRIGSTWSQQTTLQSSNIESLDIFGPVGLNYDGNTLVVGAYSEDSNATGINGDQSNNDLTNSGAIYVFTRSGVSWSQQAYIKASNPDAYDGFGVNGAGGLDGVNEIAISNDGNNIAVTAVFEDSSATGINGDQFNNGANASGAVYVFVRNGTTWSQLSYIKATNTGESDLFGSAVGFSGDGKTLVIGALYESSSAAGIGDDQDNDLLPASGAVYLY